MQKAEVDAARGKALVDLSAYDYYLRGRALRQTSAKGPTLESRAMFEKAIEIDPKFALAYAELAFTHYLEISLRWDVANRERALAKGWSWQKGPSRSTRRCRSPIWFAAICPYANVNLIGQ